MQKSKLIQILKTFSKQEMKDFEKFISSPYFSSGRNLKPLFNVLKKFHPSFASDGFTAEKVFRKLYPGKKYEKKKSGHALGVLESEMAKLAERFLVHESIEKVEDGGPSVLLGNSLFYRKLYRIAEKTIIKNKNNSFTNFDFPSYNGIILTNETLTGIYKEYVEYEKCLQMRSENLLYAIAYYMDVIYLYLSTFLVVASKSKVNKRGFKLVEHIINSFSPELFVNELIEDDIGTKAYVIINYYICKINLKFEDENDLVTAMNYYYDNFSRFKDNVKWRLFMKLHNICTTNATNIDYQKFGMMANKLSDFVLKNGCYSVSKDIEMTDTAFFAIFTIKYYFLSGNELHKFVDDYIVLVQKSTREWFRNLAYVYVYLKKKDFDKGLKLLSGLKSNELIFRTAFYKLKLALLYDAGLIEESIYNMDAFAHFLKYNQNIPENVVDENLNFINIVKFLLNAKQDKPPILSNDLERIYAKNKNSRLGFWIKEKLEEIKCKVPN